MKSTAISFLFLLFLSGQPSFATDYYMDKSATGNNSGSSWANAWQSFSDINWATIQPGDIIWVSGGTSGKTYSEKLTIEKSGTSGNPVFVKAATQSGHNGTVTIDGQNSRGGIRINADYVVVDGFTIQNANGSGDTGNGAVNATNTTGAVIKNITTHVIAFGGVVHAKYADNLTISGCYVTTPGYLAEQTDGMFIQHSSNLLIEHNTIVISNAEPDEHCDLMQLDDNDNGIVRYNYLEHDNSKSSNSQGIYISNGSGGRWQVYGNLLVSHSGHKNGMIILGSADNTAYLEAYNNTLYGGNTENGMIRIVNCEGVGSKIKNNVIVADNSPYTLVTVPSSLPKSSVTHNLIFNGNSNDDIIASGGGWTAQQWVNAGGVGTISTNPQFVNPMQSLSGNFHLMETSAAVDAGNSLGSPYNIDIEGISRPQGSGWDMGAYEMSFGPDITPPEVTGAVLLDSVTLKISFSEPLEETSAEDINNYSINNNITVNSATLNVSVVTLTTSAHSPGEYTVTVFNVKDLAGNQITSNSNSADYEMDENPNGELLKLDIIDVTASVIPQPDHTPEKTIDGKGYYQGDPDSRWAGDSMPEWIQFDLGSEQLIFLSKLSFYRWNEGRTYDYSILVSPDNNNWTEVLSNVQSTTEEWTINEYQGIEARYFRVVFHNSNQTSWASLWECEIWGYDQTNSNNGPPSTPGEFILSQNYPNPFNPATTIEFSIPKTEKVKLEVFNLTGEKIETLAEQEFEAGKYSFVFSSSNIPSGIYFYRILTPSFQQTKKMILLR